MWSWIWTVAVPAVRGFAFLNIKPERRASTVLPVPLAQAVATGVATIEPELCTSYTVTSFATTLLGGRVSHSAPKAAVKLTPNIHKLNLRTVVSDLLHLAYFHNGTFQESHSAAPHPRTHVNAEINEVPCQTKPPCRLYPDMLMIINYYSLHWKGNGHFRC